MLVISKKICAYKRLAGIIFTRCLSSGEVSAALRPFYFAVHPDLFCQHPHEKAVNENSLKSLNEFLDGKSSHKSSVYKNKTTNLTFYVRNIDAKNEETKKGDFQRLTFNLIHEDLKETIKKILTASQLSTEYIDKLKSQRQNQPTKDEKNNHVKYGYQKSHREFGYDKIRFAEQYLKSYKKAKSIDLTLKQWLHKNMSKSYLLLLKTNPVRDEVSKIRYDIMKTLNLIDIVWDCGYGLSHRRGCFRSFHDLMNQHPHLMNHLNGKILVFGTQSGISLDGHVILNIEDVRQRWLDIIKLASAFDDRLKTIPRIEKKLSSLLRGINIVHRNFCPIVTVQSYEKCLKKLTHILGSHLMQEEFISTVPSSLKEFELVIESESGPLMLSPTGQFISPSSCPAYLLIDFINRHLEEARYLLENYKITSKRENYLIQQCKDQLQLSAINKDGSVTPDMMIDCCERILKYFSNNSVNMYGYRLFISNYYFVNQDGDMYIPWNWKM